MTDLDRRQPDGVIYRLGRRDPGAWRFPDWVFADKRTGTFGCRYDDPESEYRVLYACSSRYGAFVEVLAYHAADQQLLPGLDEIEENDVSDAHYPSLPPGHLDLDDFCSERCIGEAHVRPDRSFAAVCAPASIEILNENDEIAQSASASGMPIPFGGEDVRLTRERIVTQQISRFVWSHSSAAGEAEFAGIHYPSRHEAGVDNWALFELEPADRVPPWSAVVADSEANLDERDDDFRRAVIEHSITLV